MRCSCGSIVRFGGCRRRRDEDAAGDAAPFGNENVVGAASGLGVHDLQADAFLDQRLEQRRVGKALTLATTKQYNFCIHVGQLFELAGIKPVKTVRRPVADDVTAADDDRSFVMGAVDGDIAWAMAAEREKAGMRGQMQFHGAPKKAEKGVG